MSQVDDAWNDVGEQFKRLGSLFKEHYDDYGVDEAVEVTDEALEEAMRSLGEGIKAAVGAVGDSIKDPELAGEMRDTAGSLFTALVVTFSELGTQVSTRVGQDEVTTERDATTENEADDATEAESAEEINDEVG